MGAVNNRGYAIGPGCSCDLYLIAEAIGDVRGVGRSAVDRWNQRNHVVSSVFLANRHPTLVLF
jgi:hypothetical protein